MRYGSVIKIERLKQGYTLKTMAKKIGIAVSHYHKIERNNGGTKKRLRDICQVLGLNLDDLLELKKVNKIQKKKRLMKLEGYATKMVDSYFNAKNIEEQLWKK